MNSPTKKGQKYLDASNKIRVVKYFRTSFEYFETLAECEGKELFQGTVFVESEERERGDALFVGIRKCWLIEDYDKLAKENYKDCQGRAKSILYSMHIQGVLERPFSEVAGGKDESSLSSKELTIWNKTVLDIASHLVEVEYENHVNNTFGIEH